MKPHAGSMHPLTGPFRLSFSAGKKTTHNAFFSSTFTVVRVSIVNGQGNALWSEDVEADLRQDKFAKAVQAAAQRALTVAQNFAFAMTLNQTASQELTYGPPYG